ncbi:MAG: heparinase II/III family protein, partial [Victivallales bacterium]
SDVFSPEDRAEIEQNFLGAIVREIQRYEIFVGRKNNHQTWFNAAYANVGVAIGDAQLVNDSIYGTGGLIWQLNNSVTDDGIWYEGTMSYHFYALRAIIENLKAVKRVGLDFSGNERLKSFWSGPLSMTFPDGSIPAIHDGDPFVLTGMKDEYLFAGEYFKDPAFAKIADEKSRDRSLPSQVLTDIGIGILRQGQGADAKCAMIDYGIHGDHHGHPDKLNLILYALGKEIFPDTGRISYSVPEYESWARTTAAHNTVAVNGKNQEPDTGKLLYFVSKPSYSACLAKSDSAYPGYVMSRFLLLADNFLIDVFSVQGSAKASLDCFLHVRGDLKFPESAEPRKITSLGDKNGYQHLKEIQSFQQSGNYVFDFVQKDGRFIRIHLPNEKESHIFTGIGIGGQLNEKVPFILRRREIRDTFFVSCYDLSGTGRAISGIKLLPVVDGNRQNLAENEAVGLKIKLSDSSLLLAFDLKEKPSPGLSFQNHKFERLLFLEQP